MIDRGIMYTEAELMPAIMDIDGCVGLSVLVDRATGRCIATSAWQTEETMRASAPSIQSLRDSFVTAFGGSSPTVDEWEVALVHRDHPSTDGACARASWLQGDPMSIDASIDSFRSILPAVEALPGFASASLLVNRNTGLAVSTVTYDGADSLAATRGPANTLRTQVAGQAGIDVLEVAEFELAVAHLRVPELV